MRLLCGLLAAMPFRATLVGDPTLCRRPMGRVVGPLRQAGRVVEGRPHPTRDGEVIAPLEVGPLPDGPRPSARSSTRAPWRARR